MNTSDSGIYRRIARGLSYALHEEEGFYRHEEELCDMGDIYASVTFDEDVTEHYDSGTYYVPDCHWYERTVTVKEVVIYDAATEAVMPLEGFDISELERVLEQYI